MSILENVPLLIILQVCACVCACVFVCNYFIGPIYSIVMR